MKKDSYGRNRPGSNHTDVRAAKDPVIMTVNGVDVPKSEFEYLYHKNSQQQINPRILTSMWKCSSCTR